MTLLRITAPHFVAGAEFDGRCVRAAPILRWMLGLSLTSVLQYCERKGWQADVLTHLA